MVNYTGSATYWAPVRPRIKIYALTDSTYSNPIYSYDGFTDVGSTTKPISLSFESLTTNAGAFSLEIEDEGRVLDPDVYMSGNRIVIECSKDGSNWQTAFKGLVRASDQKIYAAGSKSLTLNGFSYLIRLKERILNALKESTVDANGQYIRTDSGMFTNNLISNLLRTNSNYVKSINDSTLYGILKTDNIAASPLADWIPRLDAAFVPVSEAIQSILDFSSGVIMVDFATDQLVIYNPDLVTSSTGIFMITNKMDLNSDDAAITMYPREPYSYSINYDHADSGSRLIASIGSNACVPDVQVDPILAPYSSVDSMHNGSSAVAYACHFEPGPSPITGLRLGMTAHGNMSTATTSLAKIYGPGTSGGMIIHPEGFVEYIFNTGPFVGQINLYKDGVVGTAYPNATGVPDIQFILQQQPGSQGPSVPSSAEPYTLIVQHTQTTMSSTNKLGWIVNDPGGFSDSSTSSFSNYPRQFTFINGSGNWYVMNHNRFDFLGASTPPSPQEICGGLPAAADADPVFAIAHDLNMTNKIGLVERPMSSIPTHVKTAQTMNEYLFNQLYVSAKPRFMFDFPSVSMPDKMPKAGDLVYHVDEFANVGTKNYPAQTGVISEVRYDFAQGDDTVLGLRKLGVTTIGIRRGYY